MAPIFAMSNDPKISASPTLFLLLARYNLKTIVPLPQIRDDLFPHLSLQKLQRKCLTGEIRLPIYRAEKSQKAFKGVHVVDLAKFIDGRRQAAIKENEQLSGPQQYYERELT